MVGVYFFRNKKGHTTYFLCFFGIFITDKINTNGYYLWIQDNG